MRCFNCVSFLAECPYQSMDASSHICEEFIPASEDEIPYSVLMGEEDDMFETKHNHA